MRVLLSEEWMPGKFEPEYCEKEAGAARRSERGGMEI